MMRHVIYLALLITHASAALFMWSNRKFQIPALDSFDEDNLQDLIEKLNYPDVTIFKGNGALMPEFRDILENYYTAYTPNGDMNTENATEISNHDDIALMELKQHIESSRNDNTLSIIVIPSEDRYKREISGENVNATEPKAQPSPAPLKGPIIYKAKSTKKDVYGLMYSSNPLQLRINSTNIPLGNTYPYMINMDTTNKDSYTRLNIKIPVEAGFLVSLRFAFAWARGYWSLNTVKIETNDLISNLSTTGINNIPAHFSYHCNGVTTFSDAEKTVELQIFDLQVQVDAPQEKFGDAYDCVDFTTVPIWSGLFVTGILGIGLVIALVMINDIKTMDKFDNQKTKQLAITVIE